MTADDPDDDALTWAGDEARGQERPRLRAARTPLPGAPEGQDPGPSGTSGSGQTAGSILLITYGLLAGVYAIFTVGWVTAVLGGGPQLSSLPAAIMYQLGEFLAIVLPALWFVAVLWLERRAPRRLVWLLVGIPLVLPWPWVLG